jgi:hypothetical protein
MWAVAILAIFAFAVDLALHVATFVCVDPGEWVQPQWVGIVLFWVPLGLVLIGANLVESRRQRRAKLDGVVLPEENPPWSKPVLWAFVAYALFNFFMAAFVDVRKGDPVRIGPGRYVADSGHGRAPLPISADEYHQLRRHSLRRGTGFLLMFYFGVATDLLFTLTGQKRFKTPAVTAVVRRFSFVFVRRN